MAFSDLSGQTTDELARVHHLLYHLALIAAQHEGDKLLAVHALDLDVGLYEVDRVARALAQLKELVCRVAVRSAGLAYERIRPKTCSFFITRHEIPTIYVSCKLVLDLSVLFIQQTMSFSVFFDGEFNDVRLINRTPGMKRYYVMFMHRVSS